MGWPSYAGFEHVPEDERPLIPQRCLDGDHWHKTPWYVDDAECWVYECNLCGKRELHSRPKKAGENDGST